MIRKIVSCGQTGVELGALDVAIKLGIIHGGWTCRGKRNEDGPLPDLYDLEESLSLGFEDALEKNISESDGTLVISRGKKTPLTQKAVQLALKHQRQFLHLDLSQYSAFEAASLANSWMSQKQIKVVCVTGLKASEAPNIYHQTKKILETAFYLGFVKSGLDQHAAIAPVDTDRQAKYPQSVEQAVARLKKEMPLKDLTLLANMQPDELFSLNSGLNEYIKQHFGLYADNDNLLQSCAETGQLDKPLPDEACAVIIRQLWEDLRITHKLRVIK